MMRITFVVPALEASGGARIIAGHAKLLADRGHQVVIVGPRARKPTIKDRVKAVIGRGNLPASAEQSHYARAGVHVDEIGRGHALESDDFPDADVILATFWKTVEWI